MRPSPASDCTTPFSAREPPSTSRVTRSARNVWSAANVQSPTPNCRSSTSRVKPWAAIRKAISRDKLLEARRKAPPLAPASTAPARSTVPFTAEARNSPPSPPLAPASRTTLSFNNRTLPLFVCNERNPPGNASGTSSIASIGAARSSNPWLPTTTSPLVRTRNCPEGNSTVPSSSASAALMSIRVPSPAVTPTTGAPVRRKLPPAVKP